MKIRALLVAASDGEERGLAQRAPGELEAGRQPSLTQAVHEEHGRAQAVAVAFDPQAGHPKDQTYQDEDQRISPQMHY